MLPFMPFMPKTSKAKKMKLKKVLQGNAGSWKHIIINNIVIMNRKYIFLKLQVNAPPPGSWEHAVDERDLTVEQWKELIYKVFEILFELSFSCSDLQGL